MLFLLQIDAIAYDEIINKVYTVTKPGQGQVSYWYDANGNKVQKYVGSSVPMGTDYIGNAVYINGNLSYISHPEGRIRYSASAPTPYMYDYFIKDHLGSTRSVITITDGAIAGFAKSSTPQSNEVKYIATSETENAAKENQLFDNVDNTRSANPNKKVLNDNYVAKIYSNSSKTILGPDITIKVMAGDCVKVSAEALYIAEKNNPKEVAQNAINNFITAFTVPIGLVAEGVTTTANNGMKNLANAILDMQNKQAKNGSPNAFLNYILYDEYMNLVAAGSGALQIKEKEGWQTLETEKMAIPQNGFLRVFSNNMEAAPMSINNTTLAVVPSKLVEEYNYYPYGLVFGSSSAASSVKKTDYLYNGKELQRNEFGQNNGLELTDYGARLYDQQIGRWNQVDALAENNLTETPYCYVGNNPIGRIDPDGNDWRDVINGIGTAIADNMYPGSNTAAKTPASNINDFNTGNKIGQVVSILIGAGETMVGGGMMGTGGAGTVLSGGSSAPVSVPLIAGGATMTAQGTTMMAKGFANFMSGNGQKEAVKEKGQFNGKQDTQSQTQKQAFNKAKDQNGIPTSQQPEKQYTTPDKKTGQPLKTYDYLNSKGEKVTIRKDNPTTYPDGGSQGKHYNAGKTDEKLKQHHDYKE